MVSIPILTISKYILVIYFSRYLCGGGEVSFLLLFLISGVGHNEDLGYIFNFQHTGSETDYLVRQRFVRFIANFAKTGNPTPVRDSLLENVEWPANTGSADIKQLNINNTFEIVTNPYNANMVFWRNTFAQSGIPPFDTY